MSAENKALTRRWFKEIWSKGNLTAVDEIVAPDYSNYDPAGPMPESGREGLKKHVTAYRAALPDLTFTVEDIMADANKVIVRWTARGTQKGPLLGIPPTGKETTVSGTSVIRIARGKVAEQWVIWDTLGMMQQLGVISPLSHTASANR
jgi:steroid delta-isomerase-like uncharacterized protein